MEDESSEQYITALGRLVETCEYGRLKDKMLRDQHSRRNSRCRIVQTPSNGP